MFDSGCRVSLGVTIKDKTGGSLVKMTPQFWIDINNPSFAFRGELTILEGSLNLNAAAEASLSNYGFYTGFSFTLAAVKGSLEVYVFNQSETDKTYVTGNGKVSFGLKAGCLFNKELNFFGKKKYIQIPDKEFWFSDINAEFGNFTNDTVGFKAWINIPCLGNYGVFISKAGVEFCDVSSYSLVKNNSVSRNIVGAGNIIGARSIVGAGSSFNIASNDVYLVNEKYDFYLSQKLSKVTLLIAYSDEVPDFKFVSPSNKIYDIYSKDVESYIFDDYALITIYSPECGSWNVESELYSSEELYIEVFEYPENNFVENLDVTFDSSFKNCHLDLTCFEPGRNVLITCKNEDRGINYLFKEFQSDEKNKIEYDFNLNDYPDGNYTLNVYDGNEKYETSSVLYKKSFNLERKTIALLPAENIRVYEIEEGKIQAEWDNPNGVLVSNWELNYSFNEDEFQTLNLGQLNSFRFDSKAGVLLRFNLCAAGPNGERSPVSKTIEYKVGRRESEYNLPKFLDANKKLEVEIGNTTETAIDFEIENYSPEYKDFIAVKVINVCDVNDKEIEEISVWFENEVLKLEKSKSIPLNIFASPKATCGNYFVKLRIENINNINCFDERVFKVEVTNPRPIIKTLSKTRIINGKDSSLSLYGANFYSGCRFYIDDKEVYVIQTEDSSPSYKVVRLPEFEAYGIKQIVVKNTDGKSAVFEFEVLPCEWNVSFNSYEVNLSAGKQTALCGKIFDSENWDEAYDFTVLECPQEISVFYNSLLFNNEEYIELVFSLDKYLAPGSYPVKLKYSKNKLLSLNINIVDLEKNYVVEKNPYCKIDRLVPGVADELSTVIIYGSNFSAASKVKFGSVLLGCEFVNENTLTFVVPDESESSFVSVCNEHFESEKKLLSIRKKGFAIYSNELNKNIKVGEEKNIVINSVGNVSKIHLSAVSSNPFVKTSFEKSEIDCKDSAVLKIAVLDSIINHLDSNEVIVQVTAISNHIVKKLELKILIDELVSISNNFNCLANVGRYYENIFTLEGTNKSAVYRLCSGILPQGLSLNRFGKLSGTPVKAGSYSFTIEADYNKKLITKSFTIYVESNGITNSSAAGLKNKYTDSNIPSTKNQLWNLSDINFTLPLQTMDSLIFVANENELSAIKMDGTVAWKNRFDANIKTFCICGSYIYVLCADSKMHSFNYNYPVSINVREEISSLVSHSNLIYAFKNTEINVISHVTDELINIISSNQKELELFEKDFVCIKDKPYFINENSIAESLSLLPIYESPVEKIISCMNDDENIFILTDKKIVVLDLDFNFSKEYSLDDLEIETGKKNEICVSDNFFYMLIDTCFYCFDKNTFALIYKESKVIDFYAGNEKVLLQKQNALSVINSFTGNKLWSFEKSCTSYFTHNDFICAFTNEKNLFCFAGDSNAYAPTVELYNLSENTGVPVLSAAEDKWLGKRPLLKLIGSDFDSKCSLIRYKVNNGEWRNYIEPVVLPEGECDFSYEGFDTQNKSSGVNRIHFKIDVSSPNTYVNILGNDSSVIQNENGVWYSNPVKLLFSAKDNLSGVEKIFVNGKSYVNRIIYDREGTYLFDYYSVDRANNLEKIKTLKLNLDFNPPEVEYSVSQNESFNVLTLIAFDSASGVKTILYRINDSEYKAYAEPVLLDRSKSYSVTFYAVDNTDKKSELQKVHFEADLVSSPVRVISSCSVNRNPASLKYKSVDNEQIQYVNWDYNNHEFLSPYSIKLLLCSKSKVYLVFHTKQKNLDGFKECFNLSVRKFIPQEFIDNKIIYIYEKEINEDEESEVSFTDENELPFIFAIKK